MAAIWYKCLTAFGTLALLSTLYKLLSFLKLYLRPSSFQRYQRTKSGETPWAMVTGASDGIGKAFAFELARRGFNVVLHGRNPEKLALVQSDLEAHYPSRYFRIIIADASDISKISFPDIAENVADIPLKILINNVGATMAREFFETIEFYSAEELTANISANAMFPLLLTGALMPILDANQPSLVLNIGSWADVGMPLFPSYGPSKAFFMTSTVELGMEAAFKGTDVEFLGLRIAQVTGTGTIMLPPSFLVPDAETWVKIALSRVGCGRPTIFPYWQHALQHAALKALPAWMQRKALVSVMREMKKGDPTGSKAAAAAAEDLRKKAL